MDLSVGCSRNHYIAQAVGIDAQVLVRRHDVRCGRGPQRAAAVTVDQAAEGRVAALKALRARIDPFELSTTVNRKLEHIYALAHQRLSPQALRAANSVASR